LRALDAAARSAAGSVSGGLTRALTRLTQGSETVSGALRRLSSEMAAAALRSAFRPIGDAAGAALGQAAAMSSARRRPGSPALSAVSPLAA
jgi:hypothetical protein